MNFVKTFLLRRKLRSVVANMKPENQAWAYALELKLRGKTADQKIAVLRTEIQRQGVNFHRVTERLEKFHTDPEL